MSEWFENEDFWTEMYPYMFTEERFESAEEEIDKILSLVEFSGTHILDLCCGPGRHSTVLAERGFSVTGVDSTAFLLQKATARASERKLDLTLRRAGFLGRRCFAALSMTGTSAFFPCHAERSVAKSKHLLPGSPCVTSVRR